MRNGRRVGLLTEVYAKNQVSRMRFSPRLLIFEDEPIGDRRMVAR